MTPAELQEGAVKEEWSKIKVPQEYTAMPHPHKMVRHNEGER